MKKKSHSVWEKWKCEYFLNDQPCLSYTHYTVTTSWVMHKTRETYTTSKIPSVNHMRHGRSFSCARMQWRVYNRGTWRFNYKRPQLLHGHAGDTERVNSWKLWLHIYRTRSRLHCLVSIQLQRLKIHFIFFYYFFFTSKEENNIKNDKYEMYKIKYNATVIYYSRLNAIERMHAYGNAVWLILEEFIEELNEGMPIECHLVVHSVGSTNINSISRTNDSKSTRVLRASWLGIIE